MSRLEIISHLRLLIIILRLHLLSWLLILLWIICSYSKRIIHHTVFFILLNLIVLVSFWPCCAALKELWGHGTLIQSERLLWCISSRHSLSWCLVATISWRVWRSQTLRQFIFVCFSSTYISVWIINRALIIRLLWHTLLLRVSYLSIMKFLRIKRQGALALMHIILFQVILLKWRIWFREWLWVNWSWRLIDKLVSREGISRRSSSHEIRWIVLSRRSYSRIIPLGRRLSLYSCSESLSCDWCIISTWCSRIRPTSCIRSSPWTCSGASSWCRSLTLPRSSLTRVRHRLKCAMLLLFLILNISWVFIRQFMILLRPLINICLWLVLGTLIVNLGLEHSTLLICNPVLKRLFLRLLYWIFSILKQVHELLMNWLNLAIFNGKRLSIYKTLDSSQLL